MEKYRRRTANNPGRPHHQNASSITKEKAEWNMPARRGKIYCILTSNIRIFRSWAVHFMPIMLIKVPSNLKYWALLFQEDKILRRKRTEIFTASTKLFTKLHICGRDAGGGGGRVRPRDARPRGRGLLQILPQLEWRTQNRPEHQAQEMQKKRAGGRIHGVLVIMLAKFYCSKILLQRWDF